MRSKSETESVAGKAGEYAQVHVKDFLHRSLAVREEEVDRISNIAPPSRVHQPRDVEYIGGRVPVALI